MSGNDESVLVTTAESVDAGKLGTSAAMEVRPEIGTGVSLVISDPVSGAVFDTAISGCVLAGVAGASSGLELVDAVDKAV